MRQRTVLVVHPSVELYGADRMALEAVAGLRAAGWRVVVVLPDDGPLVPLVAATGAEVVRLETPVLRKSLMSPRGAVVFLAALLRSVPRAARLLARTRPDVVYVSTVTVPLWLAAARLARRPVVSHVHEAEEQVPGPVRRALVAPLLLADAVLANSEASRSVLVAQFRSLAGRVRVIYNGVAAPEHVEDPRELLHPPVRLVLVGRVSPRKGTDVAVAALAGLVRDGRDVTLDLVGSVFPGYEWFERQVRDQAETDGVTDRVRWTGLRPEPYASLAAADVVLVPSRVEPFGNTAVEALLARRPVIASATQGLREIVVPGVNGELVPPGDPQALADAVRRVVDDWAGSLLRVRTSAEDAAARFSLDRYRRDVADAVARAAGLTT